MRVKYSPYRALVTAGSDSILRYWSLDRPDQSRVISGLPEGYTEPFFKSHKEEQGSQQYPVITESTSSKRASSNVDSVFFFFFFSLFVLFYCILVSACFAWHLIYGLVPPSSSRQPAIVTPPVQSHRAKITQMIAMSKGMPSIITGDSEGVVKVCADAGFCFIVFLFNHELLIAMIV